jgi:hypothetical protein
MKRKVCILDDDSDDIIISDYIDRDNATEKYRMPKLNELKLDPKQYYNPPGDNYCGYHVMQRICSFLDLMESATSIFYKLEDKQPSGSRINDVWANSTDFDHFVNYIHEKYNKQIFIQAFDKNNIAQGYHCHKSVAKKRKMSLNDFYIPTREFFIIKSDGNHWTFYGFTTIRPLRLI